ncbi:hypothetical protein D4R71_09065 [bacterium]|nr:MAG: hypothetical protein D4R71_09065 [bacterium]
MSYDNYLRGSVWRKWDLHVHTPASFHWNGGKKFSSMSKVEKDDSLKVMYDTIEQSDIAVFCIMDYWTFDGYFELMKYVHSNSLKLSKTVLPGMELRIEAPVDYRLNIHVILSNELSNQQLVDFKSKITIRSIERQISDEALMDFAKSLDDSKSKIHGFNKIKDLTNDQLLELGSCTAEITKSSLHNAINSVPKGYCYILMPYDTSDGLKKLDWETQPHADNYFMQSSHIFESRDEETIDLFLGKTTDKNRNFIQNFLKTIGSTKKPVICGSDAHKFSDYGNFPSNKITWIKANPTFEGLKQIIYEPKERVQIQSHSPENITPYLIIDKVRFLDKTSKNLFPNFWIHLNPNLNVIIGGKSSGKSILLRHIAKAIAPESVEGRLKEIELDDYDFGEPDIFDFEVYWHDDFSNKISEDIDRKTREITYLPQMYINFLAERKGEKNLKNLINSILKQNDNFKSFINVVDEEINELEEQINISITELLSLRQRVSDLYQSRKEIGDERAIKIELKRLEEHIDKLRKESGFSEKENIEYEKLIFQFNYHEKKKTDYSHLYQTFDDFKQELDVTNSSCIQQIDSKLDGFSYNNLVHRHLSYIISFLHEEISRVFDNANQKWQEKRNKIEDKIKRHQETISSLDKELEPFKQKIKNRGLLKRLDEQLILQKSKLHKIKLLNEDIKNITSKGKKTRDNLFDSYTKLLNCYKRIDSELKKTEYSKIDDEIFLKSQVSFNISQFSNSFSNLFDRRGNFSTIFGDFFDSKNDYIFDSQNHIQNILTIFDKLSNLEKSGLKFKTNVTPNEAFLKLFDNCFDLKYTIEFKGDDILKMSPGKKGLVLLQLILHISNASHPILIDQPEDNLDNRTIFNELKRFVDSSNKCNF